ncbi:MFS transporter [Mycolicibacterium sp. P9-64]|uniref:MFS transporter n=1 Tax=Mycolicibacterium sp. P9-64 TaxID=2024612 RepID=UPI0011ED3DF5|nr:MFS transporter [Mycolicibacterium sp. P9-64]
MTIAWSGTSVVTAPRNALLGRQAVASVGADRAAMGSGANDAARYLGAAVGITLFVVIATHVGDNLVAGWNAAVLVSSALTVVGACAVVLVGKPARTKAIPPSLRSPQEAIPPSLRSPQEAIPPSLRSPQEAIPPSLRSPQETLTRATNGA